MKSWFEKADKSMSKMWTKLKGKGQDRIWPLDTKRSETFSDKLYRSTPFSEFASSNPNPQRSTRAKSLPEADIREIPKFQTLRRGSTCTATVVQINPNRTSSNQLKLYDSDAGLEYAKFRIKQTQDFDTMLRAGFPKSAMAKDQEFLTTDDTLFISLTPSVAEAKL
ncbi:hypothetical protein DSO57_1004933 [Entomophthora muscae]|uniref:Uncharacterized protein n=1 Tax=Entomophthora muscae TaxID=34485 RepID=A0ACC2T806_9FUNG|nr:hypothetical protein DSO57_1004933 [Entomophthora muscae]